MVVVRKRRTLDDEIHDRIVPNWQDALRHSMISGIINDPNKLWNQSIEAGHLLQIASLCKRGTLLQIPHKEKVFMYLLCFVTWRMFGKSLLTDSEYAALARHLFGSAMLDKIDHDGIVPLAHRLSFIFDVPRYAKEYRKAGSMPIPMAKVVTPSSTTVNKLRLHRIKLKK